MDCTSFTNQVKPKLLDTQCRLSAWLASIDLSTVDAVTIDLETSGLSPCRDIICGIALNVAGRNVYIPVGHERGPNIDLGFVRESLGQMLSSGVAKIFHNAVFDLSFLLANGFDIGGACNDTRLIAREHYLRDKHSYSLKDLAAEHFGLEARQYDDDLAALLLKQFGTDSKANIHRLNPADVCLYACSDVYFTRKLFDLFKAPQSLTAGSLDYLELQQQVVAITAKINTAGLAVDEARLTAAQSALKEQLGCYSQRLENLLARSGLNFDSPLQMLGLLHEHNLQPVDTKTGKPSAGLAALRTLLYADIPWLQLLIKRREISNQVLPLNAISKHLTATSRVHTTLFVSAQRGERFSSSKPSLHSAKRNLGQNEVGIRSCIVPDPDNSFFLFDFAASHFRILAHLCGDEGMLRIFHLGIDFHKAVAAVLLRKPYTSISKAERDFIKPIGFSLIYGKGAVRLASDMNVSVSVATRYLNTFLHCLFPRLGSYLDKIKFISSAHGYLKSGIFGIPIAIPKDRPYKGLNYLVQVTESEILKIGMVAVAELLQTSRSKIAFPYHDELVCQIHHSEHHFVPKIRSALEYQGLLVPMVCDVSIARGCWANKTNFPMEMQ